VRVCVSGELRRTKMVGRVAEDVRVSDGAT
jgi:hypothetical protein